jgi:hypothetical protein
MSSTIFVGPDQKKLGIRFHQIFVAKLPIKTGTFPQHVKDAVAKNPGLENSFMSFEQFATRKLPPTPPITKANAAPVVVRQGTPIKARRGLTRR